MYNYAQILACADVILLLDQHGQAFHLHTEYLLVILHLVVKIHIHLVCILLVSLEFNVNNELVMVKMIQFHWLHSQT